MWSLIEYLKQLFATFGSNLLVQKKALGQALGRLLALRSFVPC